MIPQDKIEEIKNKADIVQIISEYVALKKRGQNYLGLCPFHSEKTPSFIVSDQKKIFHCFGCGEGGNVISFIMRRENVDFLEAVEILAGKIGMAINLPKSTAPNPENSTLKNLIEQSKIFFQNQLNSPSGEKARQYLKQRGIDEKTVRLFEIGFAPDGWEALTSHLVKRGFKKEDMEKAGLSIKHPEKLSFYDRFRSRIMFPIFDAKGNAIAFGGRILGEGEPKYMNSPDTPIYQKSRHIFGLNFAKKENQDAFLIVEGYLDLITCHQFGFTQAVATLGTALTPEQAQLMGRWRRKFILAFDADPAGLAAALKNIEPLKKIRAQIYIALLKGGKDPDEILGQKGPDFFKEIIHAAIPWIEFKMQHAAKKYNLSKVEDKITCTRHLAQILNEIEDPLEKKEYLKWTGHFIQQDEATLMEEMQRQNPAGKKTPFRKSNFPSKPPAKSAIAEEIVLREILLDPQKKEALQKELREEHFSSEINRLIFKKALDKKDLEADNLSAQKALAKILMSENYSQNTQVLSDCIRTIKSDYLHTTLSKIREEIRQAERDKQPELLPSLQKQFSDLVQEIKSLK